MSAKFSASRIEAFLAALRETGNQTLAAERAKVSRSWVQLHRSGDPEFKRAMDEAVAEAKARLGAHPERRPSSGWGYLDGEELVVRGTGGSGGGKRVQIARARLKQWSPRVEERFLASLAATCNVKAACAEIGMTAASAYGHRRRWSAFARRWNEAVELGYTRIECGLIEAAGNMLSGEGLPDVEPLRGMTVDHAIHLLHMHKHQVHGLGKRPGLPAREPDIEDVRAEILRKVAAIERGRARGEAALARDREEWAQRRDRARLEP
jgi:hypothetical protein